MSVGQRVLLIFGTTLAICAVYAGYLVGEKRRDETAPTPVVVETPKQTDEPLIHWSFVDLEGRDRHMSEWAGKIVVVNFWATWCPPCRKEIPGFIALQSRFATENVQFIGIALDRAEPVSEYAKAKGMNYPVLVGEESVASYMRALGNQIGALPYSAIISPAGEIVATHQGEWAQPEVEAAIRAVLQRAALVKSALK